MLAIGCQDECGAIMAETDPASYWIVIDGKNFKTGEPIATERFGPYASAEEAERAEPDLVPCGPSDYTYWIHIDALPGEQSGTAAKEVDR